jgi:hypothetical protein
VGPAGGTDVPLILQWRFEGGDANLVAHDTSGNEHDGTVVNAVPLGAFDQGLSFEGGSANQYVSLASTDALTPGTSTFDLWFYPYAVPIDGNNYMLIHKYQNNNPGNSDYLLELIDGVLVFATQGNGTLTIPIPAPNTWYHVTAIASPLPGASHLFVNGMHVSGTLAPTPAGDRPLVIGTCGGFCAPNNRTFNGIIDEVRLFNGTRIP